MARDDTQLIVNKLWDLETERIDNFVVAKLPSARTILPRSKPIPKPKMPTKWELFAKQKGIQKKKKDKLVWDEETKEWKPKYGYRGINQKKTNQWLIEIPDNAGECITFKETEYVSLIYYHELEQKIVYKSLMLIIINLLFADPNVDYFAKEKEEKNERIAKNEFQRLRNIARNQKLKVPGVGGLVPDQVSQSKDELLKASNLAKQSTASLGKFTESLPKEKPMKKLGKKRKFESNLSDLSAEKERNLAIISNLTNKKPKVNIDKAVDNVMKPQKFRYKILN